MAIARLQVHGPRPTSSGDSVDDTVELYQRTYSTLLRSSGETRLRVLEPSHRAMGSSLHPLADSDELDLGAFLYAIRRLPAGIVRARRIAMGQDPELFRRFGVGPLEDWEPVEAPARRRRWYDGGGDTLAVLLASASDVDDLVPTLVAFQIEWNKITQRMRAAGWPDDGATDPEPEDVGAGGPARARPAPDPEELGAGSGAPSTTGCACATRGARRSVPSSARSPRA